MTVEQGIQNASIARLQRVGISVNLALGLSYIVLWLIAGAQGLFWNVDFSMFYTGGTLIREGLGRQLYDLELQTQYQQELLQGHQFSEGLRLLPYNYPPYVALFFALFTQVSLPTAFLIWAAVQSALLVWLLRLLYQIARPWQPYERWLLLTAVAAFPPLMSTFLLGALSLWILICQLQFYLALKNDKERRGGLWLMLGMVKPQLMLLPSVLILGARRGRALATMLLVGGILIVFVGVWLGWEIWIDFLRTVYWTSTRHDDFGIYPEKMHALKGTLTLLLGNDYGVLINPVSVTALFGAILLALQLWRGPWRPGAPDFELRLGLTLLLGLLFSLHLYPHDGLLLVVPATLFYIYLRWRNLPRLAYAVFIVNCPWLFLVGEYAVKGQFGIRIQTLAMVALMIWMCLALYKERRTELQPYGGAAGV